jgi:hypothetical protein
VETLWCKLVLSYVLTVFQQHKWLSCFVEMVLALKKNTELLTSVDWYKAHNLISLQHVHIQA